MLTTSNLAVGLVIAVVIGLSKSAVPGGGLIVTPVMATLVSGRLVAGATLPLLIVADVVAVRWFGRHARRDVLGPLVRSVALGFVLGALFYVVVGKGGRSLDVVLGVSILTLVCVQTFRMIRKSPPVRPAPRLTAGVGIIGGFTTFVANAAGPVLNTYLTGIGLPKDELIGTSAWFYFGVNVAKVPVYVGLGAWASAGGRFFTADSLRFDLILAPVVVASMFVGRWLLARIPQSTFNLVVLVLAGICSLRLLLGF